MLEWLEKFLQEKQRVSRTRFQPGSCKGSELPPFLPFPFFPFDFGAMMCLLARTN